MLMIVQIIIPIILTKFPEISEHLPQEKSLE